MWLASLTQRRLEPEIMDQPGLDPRKHIVALRALARVNLLSASNRMLWQPIAALAREKSGRGLRVLDVASGGGDVSIRLWRRAQRAGVTLDVFGVDTSSTAIDHARQSAQRASAPITFSRMDVLDSELPAGFDVVFCSLFLHHLTEAQAVALLTKMARASQCLVLVNDLRRCRMGYLAAWLGTRVLTTSNIVHADGPASVEAAFTMAEAQALAERAGLAGATVAPRWPWRYLLTWQKQASRSA